MKKKGKKKKWFCEIHAAFHHIHVVYWYTTRCAPLRDGELTPFNDGPCHTGGSRSAPPVTYTALQMLFGDTCAVYLMELKAGEGRLVCSRGGTTCLLTERNDCLH